MKQVQRLRLRRRRRRFVLTLIIRPFVVLASLRLLSAIVIAWTVTTTLSVFLEMIGLGILSLIPIRRKLSSVTLPQDFHPTGMRPIRLAIQTVILAATRFAFPTLLIRLRIYLF
jgi:hypothetical protein